MKEWIVVASRSEIERSSTNQIQEHLNVLTGGPECLA